MAILAVAAVIMAVRQNRFTPAEQVIWIVLAAFLFGLEIRSIYRYQAEQKKEMAADREAQERRFATILEKNQQAFDETMKRSDAIINKATEAASFAGGGDTFPVVYPVRITQTDGREEIGFDLGRIGKYPLYGLLLIVGRPYAVSGTQTKTVGTTVRIDEYNNNFSRPLLFLGVPSERVAYYSASIWARNGQWEEVIEARRIASKLVFRWVVFGAERPGVAPSKKLLDLADQDFPAGARHNKIYPLDTKLLPPAETEAAKQVSQ